VNDIQREVLVKRGIPSSQITVLMNVPDYTIFRFNPKKVEPFDKKGSFNMVYHGTIERMLGIDLAIQAVSRLRDKIPGLHFYILGGGKHFDEFRQLSKNLGIEDRIHFMGSYPLENLPAFLKDMDLGIIPNRKNRATELMLPVKLLEYVAIGIPVVSARLKTIEHYFSDDMISYYEPENVDSMANAILALFEDDTKRHQQAANATTFLERFGWQMHQMELRKLY
jgi:glycosyltransferase involved in cell wall biosynthesis